MRHKIICQAPGDECLACPHYYGNADVCRYAETDKPVDDFRVIDLMTKNGGGFVRALAEACRRADPENLQAIKRAFPLIWEKYSKMV